MTKSQSSLPPHSLKKSSLRILSAQEVFEALQQHAYPTRKYAAMYSSWLGGITKDPNFMLIPVDDHGFHRGDAVFEAMKFVDRKIYTLDRHLDRMKISSEKIGITLPTNLREIAIETTRASGLDEGLIRTYVSRGPGSFTTNPYESVGVQTYLVITPFTPLSKQKYEDGVSAMSSTFRVKEGFFATVKSCNYLPNVMMKKEALDHKVDFTVSFDENGYLTEGSTENFAILSEDGYFTVPAFDRMLKGVTLVRMMELAASDPKLSRLIKGVRHGRFTKEDLKNAREAFFLGTTLDCVAVTSYDGAILGSGKAGPVAKAFLESLQNDIRHGPFAVSIDS